MIALRVRNLHVYRLEIPLRLRFEHAAATRGTSDPVIVRVTAAAPYAHHVGFGETLARPYVTGESADTVIEDVTTVFAPRLSAFAPRSFAETLDFLETLPTQIGGRVVTAARAAVELALLDLCGRVFRRRAADIAGWLGLPGFVPLGCIAQARYSGIVLGRTRAAVSAMLRAQRLYGLRDFKLKVGTPGWEERLTWAAGTLRHGLARGSVTLRVDANGAWSLEQALRALPLLERARVCAIEQPLSESADDDLPELARHTTCALIADESLLTQDDADRLIRGGGVRVFNVRIAKNGGLLPALRIARRALAAGLDVQLGCLVGETSILTAAGIAFLELCPRVRFVEGAFGTRFLRRDVVRRSIRFGWAGRIRPRPGFGLGVEVDQAAIDSLAVDRVRSLSL